jgi:hypothetical protein
MRSLLAPILPAVLAAVLTTPLPLYADAVRKWSDQTIYVPLYSHIYADERYRDKPFALTATLAIRNTDAANGITLDAVDYFDSEGHLLRRYIDAPVQIAPMGSTRYIVRETDKGGSGAKFIVKWHSPQPVTAPIVESVMIGTQMQQGISFISQGRVIDGTYSK